MHYEARAVIHASPTQIWRILTDAAHIPQWDSGIQSIEGRIAPGERIRLFSDVNPGRAFPLRVGEWVDGRSMVWSGGMPLGLFRGVRTYRLTPEGDTTVFTIREEFSGPLLPLIARSMPDLGPSFERFARGLKAEAEAAVARRD